MDGNTTTDRKLLNLSERATLDKKKQKKNNLLTSALSEEGAEVQTTSVVSKIF